MTTQIQLPGIPEGNSLPDLRAREADLESKVSELRRTFNVCGYLDPSMVTLAPQLAEVKKQIALRALVTI